MIFQDTSGGTGLYYAVLYDLKTKTTTKKLQNSASAIFFPVAMFPFPFSYAHLSLNKNQNYGKETSL